MKRAVYLLLVVWPLVLSGLSCSAEDVHRSVTRLTTLEPDYRATRTPGLTGGRLGQMEVRHAVAGGVPGADTAATVMKTGRGKAAEILVLVVAIFLFVGMIAFFLKNPWVLLGFLLLDWLAHRDERRT